MDTLINSCRNFLRYSNCEVSRENDGITKFSWNLCQQESRVSQNSEIKNLHYTWQSLTGSNLELTYYCGLKIGNKVLIILDNKLSFLPRSVDFWDSYRMILVWKSWNVNAGKPNCRYAAVVYTTRHRIPFSVTKLKTFFLIVNYEKSIYL